MPWMNIKCRCGHEDDYMTFTRTAIYGDLPKNHFQCPGCGHAWKHQESEHQIFRYKDEVMIIPGKVQLVSVDARL